MSVWRRIRNLVDRTLDRGAFAIFGKRSADSGQVDWVAGNGGHGGDGGQTPPHVPYDPDWDPRNRRP